MARIPLFQRQTISTPTGIPQVQTDISGVARGLEAVAGAIATRHERLRKADEQMLQVKMDNVFSEMKTSSLEVKGRAAQGLTETLNRSKDDMFERMVSEVEDPVTRQNMAIRFEKSFGDHMTWTRAYELQEQDSYLKQVDVAFRQNESKKLNIIPVGDTKSIDEAINTATVAAASREGAGRWSAATNANYHQATTNEMYSEQIARWFKEAPDEAYKWFEENRKMLKQKLSPKTYNAMAALQESQYDEAETFRVYNEVRKDYGANLLAGAVALTDPANYSRYGIESYKHANAAWSMLRGAYNMEQALDKKRREDRIEAKSTEWNQWLADLASMPHGPKRNASYRSLMNAIRTDTDMDPDEKRKRIKYLKEANFYSDPVQIAKVKAEIDAGVITQNSQIHSYVGGGIGTSTTELENYLAKKLKLDADGESMDFVAQAGRDYDKAVTERSTPRTRRGDKVVLRGEEKGHFMLRLEAERRAKGYTRNDPRVLEIADQLMTKQWYKGEEVWEQDPRWRVWGEQERFGFQAPASPEVQTEMERMQEGTPEPQSPAAQPAKIQKYTANDFKNYRANPDLIPGESVDAKLIFMEEMFQEITGSPMTDEDKTYIRGIIEGG